MKKSVKKVASILIMALFGGVIGYSGSYLIGSNRLSIWDAVIFLFALLVSFNLHVIIHEAGHGIFGKLSGYKMVSYRIFSFMWIWQKDGKVVLRRFKVPGTLGQCLMAPPPYVKGKFPFRLYLLGGVLANLITSSIVGMLFLPDSMIAAAFFITGMFIVITNGFPIGFNDGMTLKIASSSEEQQYLLYVQFETNYQLNQGKTYLDLPENFFQVATTNTKQTYLNDYQYFLRLARFSEKHDWRHLNDQIEALWDQLDLLPPPYQIEVKKELLFSLAITKPEDERISQLWSDKKVQLSLKQPLMGNKRIKASYYYFIEHDLKKALEYLKVGKNLVDKAPNSGDAKAEMTLNDWLQEQILLEYDVQTKL
ncbi:hypothetical protein ACWOC1_05115 [Enterococcus quebecensis]|uniref:Peptidase M50 domain-containing protein n=1 Tax=Enterococcus quebecensis TaxID=903983 RepID=A0A1E5GUH2_9ENTE|nr:hypothetical protein [Enterococcus quebecensis]OEG16317.1 hypothetical protein BCR23_05355 [Enterococcus quebecensis]OJG74408.1 hypothetical protein RV12_GL002465 [Enterococcus quebecensis]